MLWFGAVGVVFQVVRFVGHSGRIDTLTIQADGALLLSGVCGWRLALLSPAACEV